MTSTTLPVRSSLRPSRRGGTHNKGRKFPIEPVRNDDFARLLAVCVPQGAGRRYEISAARLRALMVVLYRSGLRVSEALDLVESDLDRDRGSVLVRNGKGGKRRLAMMDEWAWTEVDRWLLIRDQLKPGALFPIITGPRAGEPLSACDVRRQLRGARDRAGLRIRGNAHSFRHGFAIGVKSEIGDLLTLQRALGHSSPAVTAIYLTGIGELEALEPIRKRAVPTIAIPHG